MKRLALVLLLGLALAPASSSAASSAAAPPGSCSWRDNGLEQDGWICLCSRVKFREGWEIWCAWHVADTVDGRITARKAKPKKPVLVVRLVVKPVAR